MARGRGEEEREREGEAFDSYSNLLATGLELPVPATRHKPESNRRREGSTGAGEGQERNREEASGGSEGGEERNRKKPQLTQRAPRKSLFGAASEARRYSLASRYTQGGHYNVCKHRRALARAYTAVSIGAHAQFRRNKRELSHVAERNIKKCVEHKATERRGRGGGGGGGDAEEEGGGAESREGRRRKRDRKAEGERDAAGIKGEADKEGWEGGREKLRVRNDERRGERGREER